MTDSSATTSAPEPAAATPVRRAVHDVVQPAPVGSAVRGGAVLAGFVGLTLPLMPVQAAFNRFAPKAARVFPHWYHRQVCRLLGLRVDLFGAVVRDRPVLLVANHTSWLDIPVLSAVAPVSFVAKKEVGSWPGVSALARLQRTVFVDRTRRSEVGATAGEISDRLRRGDAIVLFAEGTSTDGNRVLPFRSSLFAAAVPSRGSAAGSAYAEAEPAMTATGPAPVVQTVSLAYTRLHGIPLGRSGRPLTGWYGDMEMLEHAWQLLKAGPIDVSIRVGEPVSLEEFADRKALAQSTEREVREAVLQLLRNPNWRPTDKYASDPALETANASRNEAVNAD